MAAGVSVSREARGFVDVAGLRMAWGYWPGRRLPVVALHGITASYCSFVGVADMLEGRRPLLAFDLRGRGDTDKPEGPYGMETHADDVAAAMGVFGLVPSVVVGHSMGAYAATSLAARHPETVAGLVLIDGGLPLALPEGIPTDDLLDVVLTAQVARLGMTFSSEEEYLDFWRALPAFSGGRWNSWVEAYLRYDLGGSDGTRKPKASENAVRQDSADNFDAAAVRARLGALSVPVLMLRATEGFSPGDPPLFPTELVERESRLIAQFEDRVVEGTTHYTIALGQQGARTVADAVVEFAKRCGR